MNDKPTKEQTAGRPKGIIVKEVKDTTKERQVKFLEETISKLESFKHLVMDGKAFIDNATMNCEQTAANKEEIGGHNIYINIDYQRVKSV